MRNLELSWGDRCKMINHKGLVSCHFQFSLRSCPNWALGTALHVGYIYSGERSRQLAYPQGTQEGRGGWAQNAKHVICTLNPVMSLSPQVLRPAYLHSDTAHALGHELAQTSSALFQPQRASLSCKIQYKQMTRKVKGESRHTNTSLSLFIIRMKSHNVTLLNCYKNFYSFSRFLKLSPCVP